MNNSTLESYVLISDVAILWRNVLVGALMFATIVVTVLGNILVVFAVLREHHMRSNLTNRFLVSLAVADLLMGGVVMPFAVVLTLQDGYWPYGRNWCDLWHAFDVLCSTASIMNLCAIAVERFWATENPISYASEKTRRRCTIMLICVWVCSTTISFPAIAWWRRTSDYFAGGPNECNFTSDQIYLISSSLVSFYIPLIVMTSVYFKIYQTATKLTRSLRIGEKVVPYDIGKKNRTQNWKRAAQSARTTGRNVFSSVSRLDNPVDKVILRIHRGVKPKPNVKFNVPNQSKQNTIHSNSPSSSHGVAVMRNAANPIGGSLFPQNAFTCGNCQGCLSKNSMHDFTPDSVQPIAPNKLSCANNAKTRTCMSCCLMINENIPLTERRNIDLCDSTNIPSDDLPYTQILARGKITSQPSIARLIMKDTPDSGQSRAKQWVSRLRIFAATTRISKFVREQKAAKTLGLVMGLFICCWLPFFVCNIFVAFNPHLPVESITFQHVMTVVTWLGYINSGINPIIYAHSMREFRRAFKRLLCSWWWNHSKQRYYNSGKVNRSAGSRRHHTINIPMNLERVNNMNFCTAKSGQRDCLQLATEHQKQGDLVHFDVHLPSKREYLTAHSEQGMHAYPPVWPNCDGISDTGQVVKTVEWYSGPPSLASPALVSPVCSNKHGLKINSRVLSASHIPRTTIGAAVNPKTSGVCAEANF
ncbi:unnamed protein product [Echinostoma caproni]|uniref:G_PROTEIN_RECEP_F1_2 domain-containing protein n=1 Tax=Echinostoma caproni TaxID=27848 RepID=A0A183A557_9TREM|nr:unnamed protein product [Echinostoma caproni]